MIYNSKKDEPISLFFFLKSRSTISIQEKPTDTCKEFDSNTKKIKYGANFDRNSRVELTIENRLVRRGAQEHIHTRPSPYLSNSIW